ncbi:MAG: DMT family protein [Aestuariivirga sp.]
MPNLSLPALLPIALLICSNVFMTFAWYGHLKFTDRPLWVVILVSWGIAFFEYCLAVPANRWGIAHYSPAELKTMQEVITFSVFIVFSVFYLGSNITLQHVFGFTLIAIGAAVVFRA